MATANPFVMKTSRKFATSPDILVAKGKNSVANATARHYGKRRSLRGKFCCVCQREIIFENVLFHCCGRYSAP